MITMGDAIIGCLMVNNNDYNDQSMIMGGLELLIMVN